MTTTNQQTTIAKIMEDLPPMSRFALKVAMFVGGISVLYYLGYLTFKGVGVLTMVLFAVGLIVMSASDAEQQTRETFTGYVTAAWEVIKMSFANAMSQQQQQQTKTTA